MVKGFKQRPPKRSEVSLKTRLIGPSLFVCSPPIHHFIIVAFSSKEKKPVSLRAPLEFIYCIQSPFADIEQRDKVVCVERENEKSGAYSANKAKESNKERDKLCELMSEMEKDSEVTMWK